MSHPWLRAGSVIIMLGVAAAAGHQAFLAEQQIADERKTERAFSALAWKVAVSLADLRAAQQAYVAAGQDRGYWVEKVVVHFNAITTNLGTLTNISTASGTTSALEETSSSVENLKRIDTLAREHAAAGQDLLASDLIFTDGLELTRKAGSHLEFARVTERAARDASTRQHRNTQGVALATAVGTGLLVTLLLLPAARPQAQAEAPGEPAVAGPAASEEEQMSRLSKVRPLLAFDAARLSLADWPLPAGAASEPAYPDPRLAAELCTDLGCLSSSEDLPSLLARTAKLLNASVIIVWVRDGTRAALRPAIVHGYPPQALARLGAIASDGDNATAAAYRTVQMQVVPSDLQGRGAIVAPLISSASCVGVMSAELRQGWETSNTVQVLASIIAAQLTTLVVADPQDRAQRA